uniref:Plexin-B1 n=1 Tax=Anabas testudineus TaxID=64144 RepID=A0A7N5ZZM5_ANATE
MLASSIPLSLLFLLLPLPPPSLPVIMTPDPAVTWVELQGAPLSHLLLSPEEGHLYVGGVDHLYQITSDLEVMSHVTTGPHLDSPDCLPPIVPQDCPSASPTHNHNKLLLMEEGQGAEPGRLIVCGSLYQGICDKRSLSNISQLIYQTSNPVDTQYVAANDPRVSTVGVVITTENKQEGGGVVRLMLVGRGYTSKGPGDIPPITTRRLYPVVPPRRAFSQEEELGKLVVGSYSEYNNHFVKAVTFSDYIYFLFFRRDMWHKKEYRTYASRLCTSDRSFYSYVEVPLLCDGGYNLAQGAWLGNHSGKPALFVVMAAGQASTPVATSRSALCIYGMAELDAMLRRAQELCYTEGGRGSSGQEEAYIEYAVSSKCLKLPKGSLLEYTCGGEHTPNPIASAVPVQATPTFISTTQLTAVITATEAGHTIAFLGDKEGQLHKVLVRPDGSGDQYGNVMVDRGSVVSADLLLHSSQQHIYVLTNSRLSKVPVSLCERQADCQSCLSVRDPYCGWCVLEGRCSRKHQCQRHTQANHWLWSFGPTNQCVTVQSLQPANQSKEEQTQILSRHVIVVLFIIYFIHSTHSKSSGFGLSSTDDDDTDGDDGGVCFRCLACVNSVWRCNWCPVDQLCTHNHSCPNQHTILNQRVRQLSVCNCVELFVWNLSFCIQLLSTCAEERDALTLHLALDVRPLPVCLRYTGVCVCMCVCVCVCMADTCFLCFPVQLYDCSAGQSDCSQCRAVPEEYGCVWCPGSPTPSCVYNQSCLSTPTVCLLTIRGRQLLTGQTSDLRAFLGSQPCYTAEEVKDNQLVCETGSSNQTGGVPLRVLFGKAERTIPHVKFRYLEDPVISEATPAESFYAGGRVIMVMGRNLDVVQQPIIVVWVEPLEVQRVKRRRRLALLTSKQQLVFNSTMTTVSERCSILSSSQMTCPTPPVTPEFKVKGVWFQLDNVRVHYESIQAKSFTYYPNPELFLLNREAPDVPYRFKPGGVIAVEVYQNFPLGINKEVKAQLGDQECEVKTLDNTHLYCEPPEIQPMSVDDSNKLETVVIMGSLQVDLGLVQYDSNSLVSPVPLAAQIGLGAGAGVIILSVLVVILMYRRKSKQALRDYKKVLLQLETLEINVGDQCRKEFTDLMTEMMDLSSDVGGPGLPLLDYKMYAERVFFPGQQTPPLSRQLDLPESRRQTVEQGLQQLNNLLNNRLFLTRFIHTLEAQQGFSQRDRGYVASLLTMALHDKLEYFTEVMKSLLQDLVQQYVAKNPKLMLRRTETVVEKMLTNWMSICLYSFLKASTCLSSVAGEPLYMLYRAIKYQVDKGPVDAVTGKAKRTLNDSHLLREDIDYCAVTLTVLVKNGVEVQPCPVKVLDTDTITQVKDKILDQVYRGAPYSQRPSADSLDLEWRSGQAGHLTLSDDDVTAVVQGRWKRINTLQHYKVPDGATVALIPRSQSSSGLGVNQVFQTGEKTPMLEGEEEEGLRLWHLVKSSEDPEIPKHRKSSMRERERAKAIPEIYLTRLLSMKGTLQKFVDDVFVAILSTKRAPPIAVRFFFDFLDDMAEKHGIDDPETVHIWKTNSLPLRFWVNILKNPQFVLDVQVTDSIDAILSVIAQTFIDSCTTSEHKVGRDSPVNKLLYAREIPRYKQLVERYYSDIHSAASGCYQEMNSTLTELSGMNNLVALHELYKYINKYYDQIIMSLEEDSSGQKMQLAYRLQQVAALVENKVTDL